MENDKCQQVLSNDDKILLTASNLCNSHADEQKGMCIRNFKYDKKGTKMLNQEMKYTNIGEIQHIVREVVLLTDDRNLRVKALLQNVPVRDIPDFIKWSGLGPY